MIKGRAQGVPVRRSTSVRAVVLLGASLALALPGVASAATRADAPAPVVVYDSIGSAALWNVASLGFEATGTEEFGDLVVLAPGPRTLSSVTVMMSSWGCESGVQPICLTTPGATFTHPLTLSVYASSGTEAAPTVGALLATKTTTFAIPFRPSHTPLCDGNAWSPSGSTDCFNGLATPVTFDIVDGPVLPDSVIWTVGYATTHYGSSPLGETAACFPGCGYDSLNVGSESQAAEPFVGADVDGNGAFVSSVNSVGYCDAVASSALRSDTLVLPAPCWDGFRPMARIVTLDAAIPVPVPVPVPAAALADYTPVGPVRVFDTRPGESAAAMRTVPKQPVGAGSSLTVKLTDLPGFVPADGVGAVSLNVTATNPSDAGFVTVFPCDAREEVSSVNYDAGQTVANAVITTVSAAGTVCFYSSRTSDLVVDLNGWFAGAQAFHGVGPRRMFDTRVDLSPSSLLSVPKHTLAPGAVLEMQMTDLPGLVPAAGVGAVSLNVTAVGGASAGFVTVYACGTAAEVSSVNYLAGETVANAVLATVSPAGTVCFSSHSAVDVVVDLNGWIATGRSYAGAGPARLFDTRVGSSAAALRVVAKAPLTATTVLEVKVTDLPGLVPASGVNAVSLNVTAVGGASAGFITVYDCGTRREVSSVNFAAGATVANAVIAPVSASGTVCFASSAPADLLADLNGWFAAPAVG